MSPHVATTLPGTLVGHRRAAEHDRAERRAGRRGAAARWRRARRASRRVPPRPHAASASKRGWTSSGVPVSRARVTTDSPPTCEHGRQHSQRSAPRSTPRRDVVAVRARRDGVVGEHDRSGRRGRPRGRDDERVAGLDASAAAAADLALVGQAPRRRKASSWAARAAAPRRGSTTHAASPRDQMRSRSPGNDGPCATSIATSSGTGGPYGATPQGSRAGRRIRTERKMAYWGIWAPLVCGCTPTSNDAERFDTFLGRTRPATTVLYRSRGAPRYVRAGSRSRFGPR